MRKFRFFRAIFRALMQRSFRIKDKVKKHRLTLILIGLVILTNLLTLSPAFTEDWYGRGVFPVIGRALRFLFGWLPFSLGDVIYVGFVLYVFFKIGGFIVRKWTKRTGSTKKSRPGLLRLANCILIIYLAFQWLWGINYSRAGISSITDVYPNRYDLEELKQINEAMLKKLNNSYWPAVFAFKFNQSKQEVFTDAHRSWTLLNDQYPAFGYNNFSVKQPLNSGLLSATGISGYYNPFTGEVQVNAAMPMSMKPFTTLHEIAHQAGLAREDEANFAGYLAAKAGGDKLQLYATYADLFLHVNNTLYRADSAAARQVRSKLKLPILLDYKLRRRFFEDRKNFLSPIQQLIFDAFLKANKQPSGILTYDEVTAYLIAYRKKFGEI